VESNCVRRNVGAVLVKNGRIIATACNGVPRTFRNCLVAGCPRCKRGGDVGTGYDSCICLHAEQMALAKAARGGQSVKGTTLYVDLRPCLACLNLAVAAGVREIVYKEGWSYERKLEFQYRRLSRRLSAFVHARPRIARAAPSSVARGGPTFKGDRA
jgi:dCMP deaminase